jgi:succinyl-diaminopimelate desuccinylase
MEIERERLVRNLQSLVKIPSFRDSLEVSRWIKNELEGLGYSAWSDEEGNLIAEVGKGPGFILNAHMDTVEPGERWKHDPFGGEIANGRIYGRGASDCKAGVAAMLELARMLRGEKLSKRVVFTFTAFEEGYPLEKNGLYRTLPRLKDIEKGLILEPTTKGNTIGIGVGCRGSAGYIIEILGERGHSAYFMDDKNPIYKFIKFLQELKKIPTKTVNVELVSQEISDKSTVTEICAQEGPNVVPSKCVISLDRRTLPEEDPGEFRIKIESVCRKTLGKDFKINEVRRMKGYLFNDRVFLDICKDAVKSIGSKPEPHVEKGRIDATILYNFANIGTFMMGPGDISQAHNIDEHCEIEGLVKATEAVLAVIKKWDKS